MGAWSAPGVDAAVGAAALGASTDGGSFAGVLRNIVESVAAAKLLRRVVSPRAPLLTRLAA